MSKQRDQKKLRRCAELCVGTTRSGKSATSEVMLAFKAGDSREIDISELLKAAQAQFK